MLGHDTAGLRSKSWHEFTGPNAPRMDFVITLCDTPDGQDVPGFRRAWRSPPPGRLPDPAQFTGSAVERAALLNELYASLRRRIEIFTALPFASLDRMAMKARLDEIAGGNLPATAEGADHARRHQRHGAHRPPGAARRDGRHVSGRGRSARRQPARCRACERAEGRRGDDGASAGIRQRPWPLARKLRRRGRSRHPRRQPPHRLQRCGGAGCGRLGRSRLRHRAGMHRQISDSRAARTAISPAA